jgi:DNA-binding NtrC family response regulator
LLLRLQATHDVLCGSFRFDVVFTDVVMQGMTGIDLAREIRRRHFDLPVVLTSGYSHVLSQNGTCGFELLQKPYSIDQLTRVLHKAARVEGLEARGCGMIVTCPVRRGWRWSHRKNRLCMPRFPTVRTRMS